MAYPSPGRGMMGSQGPREEGRGMMGAQGPREEARGVMGAQGTGMAPPPHPMTMNQAMTPPHPQGGMGLPPGGQPMGQRPSAAPPMGSPTREVNTASLCRIGQEFVQEIVQKTLDIFTLLRQIQLPNGANANTTAFAERKGKLEDSIQQLSFHFKRLRLVYEKVNEITSQFEQRPAETLVPTTGELLVMPEDVKPTEASKYVSEEHHDLVQQVRAKNEQLKEMIDHLRLIIWEINTMMAMKKT